MSHDLQFLVICEFECSARNCNIPSLVSLAVGFFKTYFLDILFSRAHLLKTLFIFRLEKVLV